MKVTLCCPECGQPVTTIDCKTDDEVMREFALANHPCPDCERENDKRVAPDDDGVDITFTCRKCGKLLSMWTKQTPDTVRINANRTDLENDMVCRDCSGEHIKTERAYGPLTVERLARFLCDCPPYSKWSDWDEETPVEFSRDDFRVMAGGVINLLHFLNENYDHHIQFPKDVYDVLDDIAECVKDY